MALDDAKRLRFQLVSDCISHQASAIRCARLLADTLAYQASTLAVAVILTAVVLLASGCEDDPR